MGSYDIIVCYCNGFVMLPQMVVASNLSYEEANESLPDTYFENDSRDCVAGTYHLMIAKQGEYELTNK